MERCRRTHGGVRGKRTGDQCRLTGAVGAKQPRKRESCRDLRAVDERKTFLGSEHDGLEPRFGKALGGGHLLSLRK